MNTEAFLREIYGGIEDGVLEVTYLANEGEKLYPRTIVHWLPLPMGEIDYENSNAASLNRRGYNVYFGVAVRHHAKPSEQRVSEKSGKSYTFYPRGKQEDALYLPALYVDIDDPGDDARWRIWELCPPSIIVSSGGGWHGYWVLSKPLMITEENRHDVKRTLKGMAIACGGDTKVAELARIMRLPGSINTKPNRGGVIAEVAEDLGGARFQFEGFRKKFAHLGGAREVEPTRYIPPEASLGLPGWVNRYLESGSIVGERNQTLYKVAREYKNNGFPQYQCESEAGSRARADGLGDEEITRTISSAYAVDARSSNVSTAGRMKMAAADHIARLRGKRGA